MIHARRDYDAIQPWPQRRPHHGRDDDGTVVWHAPVDADLAPLIPADEPVFLVRGQDVVAPSVLRYWADCAEAEGAEKEIIDAVRKHAGLMEAWQQQIRVKVPDAEKAVLR